jgi:hypothetical protein
MRALASMIPRGLLRQAHIYPLPQYVDSPSPTTRSLVRRFWPVRSEAIQLSGYGLRRIPLPRTWVNKAVAENARDQREGQSKLLAPTLL